MEQHEFEQFQTDEAVSVATRYTQVQKLDLMRNLVSLLYVDIADSDWINCHKIQLIIKKCTEQAVAKAWTIDEVLNDESLQALFKELTDHQTAKDYTKYLFQDVLNTTDFYLESISEKAVEDPTFRRSFVSERQSMIGSLIEDDGSLRSSMV